MDAPGRADADQDGLAMPSSLTGRGYICPECEARFDAGALIYPVPEVEERVLPGEAMPAGECPECGALVPVEIDDEEDA